MPGNYTAGFFDFVEKFLSTYYHQPTVFSFAFLNSAAALKIFLPQKSYEIFSGAISKKSASHVSQLRIRIYRKTILLFYYKLVQVNKITLNAVHNKLYGKKFPLVLNQQNSSIGFQKNECWKFFWTWIKSNWTNRYEGCFLRVSVNSKRTLGKTSLRSSRSCSWLNVQHFMHCPVIITRSVFSFETLEKQCSNGTFASPTKFILVKSVYIMRELMRTMLQAN